MSEQEELRLLCRTLRQDILTMIHKARSGHPGGSLSAVELLAVLYFTDIFHCFPPDTSHPDRDRFILSKGHAAPLLYSILANKGFFPVQELISLRTFGSSLQGHPNMNKLPALDCSSGSLGQGLSIANGLAYGLAYRHLPQRVYCLLGDGELQEGQIWEAAMFAAQQKLDHLCVIVDRNGMQLNDSVNHIKNLSPLADKWKSFGWHVMTIDGHDLQAVHDAYKKALQVTGKPTVILADTIKGKGISFMENKVKWHGTAPNDDEYKAAMLELTQGVQS
jgi:transketolase